MTSNPSNELARLREELAREENDLAALEDNMETRAAQLGYLHNEYTINKAKLCHHFEPRLEPLRVITYAAEQKASLLHLQIEWLESKVVEQERRSQGRMFVEMRDMKPAAEELMKGAQQAFRRVYEHIRECSEESLRIMSHYTCPPDTAIATMELVMRIRGEAPEDCTWSAAQVLLSHTYFHDFFEARSESLLKRCDLLSNTLMSELEQFCADPHHSVAALYTIGAPLGCIGEWLYAIRNYYRIKMVTAPVLLASGPDSRSAAQHAHAWLNIITMGEDTASTDDAEGAASLVPTDAAEHEHPDELIDSKAADSDEGKETADDDDMEEGSEHRAAAKQSAAETAAALHNLRQRLHRLRESVRATEEERAAVEQELQAKLDEVRGTYDDTMVPLEDQLEEATECFRLRIAHKEVDDGAEAGEPSTAMATISATPAASAQMVLSA